jgi:hypothetical protein
MRAFDLRLRQAPHAAATLTRLLPTRETAGPPPPEAASRGRSRRALLSDALDVSLDIIRGISTKKVFCVCGN